MAVEGFNPAFDVFIEEKPLFVGEPYGKGLPELSRHRGKQFAAPWQPSGRGSDAMIDKHTLLALPGDTWVDPTNINKQHSSDNKLHAKPFIPGSPPKKPCGSGSLYGVLGSTEILLDTDASLGARSGSVQEVNKGKRNIYVSPAKKGSFGFPLQDRSIGATRFDFIPDEYNRGRILEREMKREARAKIPKPFISTAIVGRGPMAVPTLGAATRPLSRSTTSLPSGKPWKAPNPPPKGPGYGTLSKLEYIAAPAQPPLPVKETGKPFKPANAGFHRQSMSVVNPYQYAARPPPDNDLTLLG